MNILFVFNLGSELRQFSHSGLVEGLMKKGHNIFISSRYVDEVFVKELPGGVTFIAHYPDQINLSFSILNRSIDISYRTGFSYGKAPNDNLKKVLINAIIEILAFTFKWSTVRNFFIKAETKILFNKNYQGWSNVLIDNKIEKLVTNVPNMNLTLLKEATALGIERILIYHTNKDILSVARMIIPYSKYGVWNESMRQAVVDKYKVKDTDIRVVGCLHFSYLLDSVPESDQELENKTLIFTYICAANNISGEGIIIRLLIDSLNKVFGNKFILYLRDNPMATDDRWSEFLSDNVKIQKPLWYYNKKVNFNYATKKDLVCFRDLLRQSTAIFGLPSTVVVEANICNKPFINVLIENSKISITTIKGNLRDLWELDNYKNVRDYSAASPVYSIEELLRTLYNLKENGRYYMNPLRGVYLKEEIDSIDFENIIQRHLEVIEKS